MEEAKTSPALRAIQRDTPPSLSASVRSGRDLMCEIDDARTVIIPQPLFAYCTDPDYTVTAALANSAIDSPVRVIAEHLFGLEYGSFQTWTHDIDTSTPPSKAAPKGVKGWLGRLNLRPKKAAAAAAAAAKAKADADAKSRSDNDNNSSAPVSDDSDGDPATDQVDWSKIRPLTPKELAEVRRCGKWRGTEPSELFLNLFGPALLTLEKNVLNGLVSPSLLGQSGVVPLTIISHSSDIVQHYCDLIVRAEHEIFFTTNVWEASESSRAIANALKELSRRVIERGGDKIVMKLMYDRGVMGKDGRAHATVTPSMYTSDSIGLPAPEDIPGVLLEVQNYHVPPVGSFHQKTVVVDRKIALLSSNNVQNRSDVGFMAQLEGPIVQSVYDSSILSWWRSFNPRPPLLGKAPEYAAHMTKDDFQFGNDHTAVSAKGDLGAMAERTRQLLSAAPSQATTPTGTSSITPVRSGSVRSGVSNGSSPARSAADDVVAGTAALSVNGNGTNGVANGSSTPTTNANANGSTPTATSPTATADASASDFNPLVVHAPHDPFPVALVNRTPRGRRGQGDAYVPQNQAWLAGFKFATKSVFIQTPTFSARPIVTAALDAVRRGVVVEVYADLGFTESGELSADGLANQSVAAFMYSHLTPEQRDKLRVYWYTAKGETSPRSASHTCHIKLMIIDEQIAIQGNGRQDMSSWYHAQEVNVMLESSQVCREWRAALDANQDTKLHGRVGDDGIWRDADGNTLPVPPLQASPIAQMRKL